MPGNANVDAIAFGGDGIKAPDAAHPVAFAGNPGLFKPADDPASARNLAVLFLPPWGIDELCTRRFFRIIAEKLAGNGIASLRFDYPGTANALDGSDATIDVDCWSAAAIAGTEALRRLSGADQVVLLGFGLGAAIAWNIGKRIEHLAGVALLAPVVAGRRYLRELSVWSTVVDEGVGVPPHMRDTAPGTIAGLTMPDGIVATLQTLTADAFGAVPTKDIFLAARPDSPADGQLRDRLTAGGARLRDHVFSGYDKLVSNPLGQKLPDGLIAELSDWLQSLRGYETPVPNPPQFPDGPAVLTCGPIRETALRFGLGSQWIGTLCEPEARDTGVTVVILSTAYDHQSGWGRSGVELARRLAQKGIASFRFDSAGVGDSPPMPGRREQVLYDDVQIDDIMIVRQFLDEKGRTGPALLYGRCSGAYVAFRAAAEDTRWAGCIAVNPYVFRWLGPPTEEMVSAVPRPLADYSRKAFQVATLRRLFSGDIYIRVAARNIGLRLVQRASHMLAPLLGPLLPEERLKRAVQADFRSLSQRSGRTCLVYSDGDVGLDNLYIHFGKDAGRLSAYPDVELHVLEDTDHNVTPQASRERLYDIVEQAALSLAGRKA